MKVRAAILGIALLVAGSLLAFKSFQKPDGGEIFRREFCVKCHQVRGVGIGVINLTGVTEHHSRVWIRVHIEDPSQHDPDIGMPSFAHLSDREIEALIDYLEGP